MGGGFLDKFLAFLTVMVLCASAGSVWFLPPDPSRAVAPLLRVPSGSAMAQAPSSDPTVASPASSPEGLASTEPPAQSSTPGDTAANSPALPLVSSPMPEGGSGIQPPQTVQTVMLVSDSSPSALQYHVQVGAFRYRKNAEELLQQLDSQGFKGLLIEDQLYRVWVGEDLERVEAEQLARDLQGAGFETYLKPRK